MRTADLWLVLLALGVLGLTAVAFAAIEARDGRVPIAFQESDAPLGESSADGVGAGGATLNWTLPANATAARIGLLVSFTGQAVRGGSATIQAQLVAPDGTRGPVTRIAFPIPQGATSGQANATLEMRWLDRPRNTTADPDGFDRARAWDAPLELVVAVQEPADLPVADYSFTARAAGTAAVYRHAAA